MRKKSNECHKVVIPRFLAFVIDCFLVSMLVSLISYPFLDFDAIDVLNQSFNQISTDYVNKVIDAEVYISSATSIFYRLAKKQGLYSLMLIFFNIMYFVVYQFYNKGQTIGKKLMKIKVVSYDSKELSIDNYIFRSAIVNSIIIDMIIFGLDIFASEQVWFVGVGLIGGIEYILLFICTIMIILKKDGRGLHDLISNTKVIRCGK